MTAATPVVEPDTWLAARRELHDAEEELARNRAAVAEQRRAMPMVEITEPYRFTGGDGETDLLGLFGGRSQLILHHAMFKPEWDTGCPACRRGVQDFGHLPHLHERDTSFAVVSRAPWEKIRRYKERMGWTVPYYSTGNGAFTFDFHLTLAPHRGSVVVDYQRTDAGEVDAPDDEEIELPGVLVFVRDGARVFHTYTAIAQALDPLLFHANYLELTPAGP